MILFIWLVALFFLALWSLAGWGLHAVVALPGGWSVDLDPWLRQVPFADWLERWFPTWQDWVRIAVDLMHAALSWLGGAAPVVVTVVWAIGAVLLVGTAALLTLMVVLLRPKMQATSAQAA